MRYKFLARQVLAMVIATAGASLHAAPLVFTSTQFDTTAFAFSGALADTSSGASPASPLPLVSTATVAPSNDFATAFAIAATGLLSASAEADSFAGAQGASSGAQSHFVGTFLGDGLLSLLLDFDSLTSLVGGGTGSGTLFVLLTSALGGTSTVLLNDFYSAGDDLIFNFTTFGTTTLDLLLFSEAGTLGAGEAGQNFAQVVFSGDLVRANAVPLPSTLLLTGVGFLAFLTGRRRARGRRQDDA